MIKKINTYLLTHFPLIWNTKALWGGLLLLLVHLFYYWFGYRSYLPYRYDGKEEHIIGVTSFAIILSILFLILWLVAYFKQNPLKAIYPISNRYLLGEKLIILIFCFFGINFMQTYYRGEKAAKRNEFKQLHAAEHINNLSLAASFFPSNNASFEVNERLRETFSKYKNKEELRSYLNKHPNAIYSPDNDFFRIFDSTTFTYSYLNYNFDEFSQFQGLPGIVPKSELKATQVRWLKNNRRDSIALCLSAAFKSNQFMLGENALRQRVTASDQNSISINTEALQAEYIKRAIDSCFKYPNYSMPYGFTNTEWYDRGVYNDFEFTETPNNWFYLYQLFIYLTVGLAALIISFRWTDKRSWLIAFVGLFIWIIVIVILTILRKDSFAWSSLNYLYLLFVIFAVYLIYKQKYKTVAGVLINWCIWLFPYIYLLCLNLVFQQSANYQDNYYNDGILNYYDKLYPLQETKLFSALFTGTSDWLIIIHLAVINLVYFIGIIPLVKKYQAFKS